MHSVKRAHPNIAWQADGRYSGSMFDLDRYLTERRSLIDSFLISQMPPEDTRPATLHRAMRYSIFAGGKRLRPILCIAAAEAVGKTTDEVIRAACALELLHTYTLVHDDLPAMDDDDLRRGKPTTHITFGEANAILAGDALLTLAFEWMARAPGKKPNAPADPVIELAVASGSMGVIGGQVEDLAAEGKAPSADLVDFIHAHKTGALLRASVRIGAMIAGASAKELDALSRYGEHMGLAFQIADDILNATSSSKQLGKATGSDEARGKMTYVAVYGLDVARQRADDLIEKAVAELKGLSGSAAPLTALARFSVVRSH